ncbi:hypothetical protein CLAFUW4_11004 [Fulvia fulva]|uniref:F-box domain-containing protein n=1 Tax=Passalora fulva TaxID=5499 RepID=A0A9Q8PC65_PASFU|nr:uncharacterized protein CLAFUR5_10047 [Fulvia fulva]KAK4619634.1 hypothetical protein CLAFUR4_11009 [Fulvia fulva]KAK4620977.1 hypothetical protein CLAFUR0_11016 [Fulvia fulva]UJO19773.1 hypothetical protein CLAFUR5_10047 [Fulvia fulva]WPV17544.1 hypothetical protein CLAFUW4_11004 [Fulvia fulva]WPV32525.1 hypothetical protein CLAFUW7_11002 [Fulvia fulva]
MAPITFSSLAAELRNEIYELAFTSDTGPSLDSTIDLRDTSPPSKALLLVCRKFHNEAYQIYREAYRSYWREQHFSLNLTKRPFNTNRNEWHHMLASIDAVDLAHIKHLHITGATNARCFDDVEFRFTRMPRSWRLAKEHGNQQQPCIFFTLTYMSNGDVDMQMKRTAAEIEEVVEDPARSAILSRNDISVIFDELLEH